MHRSHKQHILKVFLAILLTLSSYLVAEINTANDGYQPIDQKIDALLAEKIPHRHFLSAELIKKNLTKYTEQEKELIYQDYLDIRSYTFAQATKGTEFDVSCGGPGAGKSFEMEKRIEGKHMAYRDPDRATLFYMKNTYCADHNSPQATYDKWKEASIFVNEVLLAEALTEGYNIAYGATMTTPFASKMFASLQNVYGYRIHLYHHTCPDEVRKETIDYRDKVTGRVQCNEKDFKEKGVMFFERLDQYLTVDEITFYYRGEMNQELTPAALWTKQDGLVVIDQEQLNLIKALHDKQCGEGYWDRVISERACE